MGQKRTAFVMPNSSEKRGTDWSSEGIEREVALDRWRKYFAERQGSPIQVTVHKPDDFTAQLVNRGVGQVRLLRLLAPAQRVEHIGSHPDPGSTDHLIHFLYALRGSVEVTAESHVSSINPGEAMMIDNALHYVLDMKTAHEVIDLIMPLHWLERHIPSPEKKIGQKVSMRRGWAHPLASLMETITLESEEYPVPRPLLAEQLGAALSLAFGVDEAPADHNSARLVRDIMARIEKDFGDPDLSSDGVAGELGISKRYLQSLLANAGTSFVRELGAIRLDRASEILTDPHTRSLPIGEVAFRCGFLDPGYFARQFRKRFDATPRAWREMS
jgi:AraC-like DNA-binding protein